MARRPLPRSAPIIRARSNQIAYAVSTIFGFNIVAVLIFPPLGHALGMNQQAFGLFAGTAVNDTSSVVAAASVYGHSATEHAVVIKLVRTLMIIPICLALAALVRRRDARGTDGQTGTKLQLRTLVPWFLVGFLLMAAANSATLVPTAAHASIGPAVRCSASPPRWRPSACRTDLAELRRTGTRPLLLGLILWVTVSVTSLLLQWAT